MRLALLIISILTALNLSAQQIKIITLDKQHVEATILDPRSKDRLISQLNGRQDNTLRKKWTARTFTLSDGKILIEFYDRQALLLNNFADFRNLERIRLVKNMVYPLKKNISYKIELSFDEGTHIVQNQKPKHLSNFKSSMPEHFDFEVYELNTGQILFLDKSQHFKAATIYPDLKTLSSDNTTIQELVYGSQDDEHLMKKLASGDALLDYEPNEHLLYPKYEKDLIKSHKLSLIEKKVYVIQFFYGNLFRSENGYYMLLDDFNQLNRSKRKLSIGTLRIYENLEDVRLAQKKYEQLKDKGVTSEHFYQKISDRYGKRFPEFVPQLIDSLPLVLNFDREQLSFDSTGMLLVDEALKWHHANYALFDEWFPSVLAYCGECYMKEKQDGKWSMHFDKDYKVWIPEIRLKNGVAAWDWRSFYKDLFEWPVPLQWVANWDGRNH